MLIVAVLIARHCCLYSHCVSEQLSVLYVKREVSYAVRSIPLYHGQHSLWLLLLQTYDVICEELCKVTISNIYAVALADRERIVSGISKCRCRYLFEFVIDSSGSDFQPPFQFQNSFTKLVIFDR
jgi:hypothetical protein